MVEIKEVIINDVHVADSVYDDSLQIAYSAALAHASELGSFVKSMPDVLALRSTALCTDPIWSTIHTCASEEDVGISEQGTKVMIEVHGGGILTPKRIETRHQYGLTNQGAARLTNSEINELLRGKLADETEIPIYPFYECKGGIKDKPRRYAVVMDFEKARNAASGPLEVETLRDNPVFIVRAGGGAEANALVDTIAQHYQRYGNHHRFTTIHADETQGRMTFVGRNSYVGLHYDNPLHSNARFLVGIRSDTV